MTLPTGTVRRLPRGGNHHTTMVEMVTADPRGDIVDGLIRVPDELTHSKEHSSERMKFDKLIAESLKRWIDWKLQHGWKVNGIPKVRGPFDPASESPDIEAEDIGFKWYFAEARFQRTTPMWIPIDGAEELDIQARRYGVDLWADRRPDTGTSSGLGKSETDIHDPMKFAAERREHLGFKREDYLFDGSER